MKNNRFFMQSIFSLTLLFSAAQAALTDSLEQLVSQGNTLKTELSAFSFEAGGSCSQLGILNTSIEEYIGSIEAVTAQLGTSLRLNGDDLIALDDLSALGRSMAEQSVRMAFELRDIDDLAELSEYRSGLSAMLRLSGDIGTMADRILEMANRILQMADNIGAMADKIVYTVTLQSANMAFIQSAMLTTQENMVQLNGSLSSIIYNVTLGQIVISGNGLVTDMNTTVLSDTNMAAELSQLELRAAELETAVIALYTFVNTNSAEVSHYLNGDTLTYFTDLSEINAALAMSIELFAQRVESIAPLTQAPVLSDATDAMLKLANDIKIMGDRMLEMTDKIIVMADNIGMMSVRIVEVQGIMNDDAALTATSLSASQRIAVGVIGTYGL